MIYYKPSGEMGGYSEAPGELSHAEIIRIEFRRVFTGELFAEDFQPLDMRTAHRQMILPMVEVGSTPKNVTILQEVAKEIFSSYGATVLNTFSAACSESEGAPEVAEAASIAKAGVKTEKKKSGYVGIHCVKVCPR